MLGISHDELHVRIQEQGQNLADLATDLGTDLGIETETLLDALVAQSSPAVEAVVASGEITEAEGEEYLVALEEAYTYRVTWDGEEATPSVEGLST